MKIKILPFIFLLLPITALFAQTNEQYLSADTLINRGVSLYDAGDYKGALDMYAKVNKNDKNYYLVLYERLITLNAMDSNKYALLLIDSLMQYENKFDVNYYNMVGTVLSNAGKLNEAEMFYANAYLKYPYNSLFIYNYAIVLYRKGDFDKAEKLLEKAICINPYHYRSHLILGFINYAKGRLVPALMCFSFASNVAPSPELSYTASLSFENAIEGKLNETIAVDSKGSVATSQSTDEINQQFTELDFLIKSGFITNKKFKVKSDIDYKFIKQTQLMFENLKLKSNASDIYNCFYIPYYNKIQELDLFEAYAYHISSFINNEKVQKKIKKNDSEIKKYIAWTGSFLEKGREKLFNPNEKMYYTFNQFSIDGIGQYSNTEKKLKTGTWSFYHEGGPLLSKGEYVNDKHQGLWIFYYENGLISDSAVFSNDSINGILMRYHENGILSEKSAYKNGILDDTSYIYNLSGNLKKTITFDNLGKEKMVTTYFENGNTEEITEYENGMVVGKYETFFANKNKSIEGTFENNRPAGKWRSYFANNKTDREMNFKKGVLFGRQNQYYPNGKLLSTYNTNEKGDIEGTLYEYYSTGILSDSVMYEKGEENGYSSYYTYKGNLSYTILSKKGKPQSYTQYDKDGKIGISGKREKETLAFSIFNANGTESFSGIFKTKKEGPWNFYNAAGIINKKMNYKNGELNGESVDYFPNGKLQSQDFFINGLSNGYYISYFRNNQIAYEGFTKDGKQAGLWKFYYPNGQLKSEAYYSDGAMQGTSVDYTYDGTKESEDVYENGMLVKSISYDENGRLKDSCTLKNGNGTLIHKHTNGKISYKVNVLGGKYYDTLYLYNKNGTLLFQGAYIEGQKNGLHLIYNNKGEKIGEVTYILGKEDGVSKRYSDKEILYSENEYSMDRLRKVTLYHENGKKRREISYDDNENSNDTVFYYSEDRVLMFVLLYDAGTPISYSYLDKNGKLKETAFDKGNAVVRAFYQNEKPSYEANYVNTWREGAAKTFHSNGNIATESNYKNDYLEGEYKKYSSKGILIRHSFYKFDELSGPSKKYSETGALQEEEEYVNGELHGTCKYYNATGTLKNTCVYYYGKLLSETKSGK